MKVKAIKKNDLSIFIVTNEPEFRLACMNKLVAILFNILIVFTSFFSLGQDNTNTITGQLFDAESQSPISFASIYINGAPIGTTSNEDGYFTFHFPSKYKSSKITISMIGYSSINKPANEFKKNEKLYLNPQVSQLNEVVLIASKKKSLTAKQVVKKAYRAIKSNYPSEPYNLDGFVRDLQNEDDVYVEYLECAVKFSYQPQQIRIEPQVELVEVRRNYIAQKNSWNDDWDRKNSVIDLVEDDCIRFDYGPIRPKGGWRFEIESVLPYNNRYVYKIIGKDSPFQTAVLYIDTETFAFVRIELTREAVDGRSWKRRLTNGQEQVYYNVVFEYQEYEGKMYLKYQKEEDTWKIYDTKDTNRLLFTKHPKKELFVNKIITDVKLDSFKQNMNHTTSIENQAKEYNPIFWETYNAPQQTKTISKIEKELKKTR